MITQFKKIFCKAPPPTANIARERLKIIISAERNKRNPNFMQEFKQDLLKVIAKNFNVEIDQIENSVNVDMAKRNGQSTLELNIALPDNSIAEELAEETTAV